MGAISEPGQMIVCVPKKILIFIPVGKNEHKIEAMRNRCSMKQELPDLSSSDCCFLFSRHTFPVLFHG